MENQTLSVHGVVCGTEEPQDKSLAQQSGLSADESPPAPRPAPPGRQQEYKDGQEEKCVQGRMIKGGKKITS